jgi:hypothetical protein
MLIHSDTALNDFNFWSGGADTANCLTREQIQTVEIILSDIYPEGMDETAVNDFFWFEEDTIAEWLGFTDFETLIADTPPWN